MRILFCLMFAIAMPPIAAVPAWAQEQTIEDKLREALRRSTVDLRALQDVQAGMTAERDSALKQRDLLQQQVDAAQAKLAAIPAEPVPPAVDPEALRKLEDQLAAAKKDDAALAASNAHWQSAYKEAATLAQAKDAEAKRLAGDLAAESKVDDAVIAGNKSLAALAGDILHLYRSESFRRILLESYEPLLGLKQVSLDNLVQGYDDKIYNLRSYARRQP